MASHYLTSYNATVSRSRASSRAVPGDVKHCAHTADHGSWLLCDGRSLDVGHYRQLFKQIGRSFGGSDSEYTFRLPDGRGRVAGAVGAVPESVSVPQQRPLGETVGSETQTLSVAQMPSHTHTILDAGAHTHSVSNLVVVDGHYTSKETDSTPNGEINLSTTQALPTSSNGDHTHSMLSAGSGQSFSIMQPTIFMGNMFIYCPRNRVYRPATPPPPESEEGE